MNRMENTNFLNLIVGYQNSSWNQEVTVNILL